MGGIAMMIKVATQQSILATNEQTDFVGVKKSEDDDSMLLYLGFVEYFNMSLATENDSEAFFHFPMVYNASYLLVATVYPTTQLLKHK